MIYKTYISKYNTIVSNSKINVGLNPISELVYGKDTVVSRGLFYFDHSKVKCLYDNGVMPNMDKMKHILHITNAGSLDPTQIHHCETSSINDNKKIRAASFDLIFFLIPKPWDRGKGYDYAKTYFTAGYYTPSTIDPQRLSSEDGSNWFNRMNGLPWDEEGIYTNDTLSLEYDKFAANEESVVIGRQHFDYGNEDIELDITDTFNRFLSGELENNGIGVAFSPLLEVSESEYENYVGWLTDKTNTFFEPYVETRYDDTVSDDRANFVLNKDNKLYLYCTIGDSLEDLDNNPTVTIRDSDENVIKEGIESKKFSKGIYYIELNLPSSEYETDTMFYDTWSNISYNGTVLDDVELDFTVKQTSNFFNIGSSLEANDATFSIAISGIQEKERVKRGDVRKLSITATPSYTLNTVQLIDRMDFRLYIMDGTREIDVIEWDGINKTFSENYYLIDTNILISQRYYVDIRLRYGFNSIIHHNVLTFDITDSINNKYV